MTYLTRQRAVDLVLAALVGMIVIAVFQRLMDSVFFHDDWTLLARAAGVLPRPDVPVRWLSFDGYWRLMHAVAGLQANTYTISRIVLHLATGIVVASVARRIASGRAGVGLFAAVLYLLTPLAFEPIFWAAGVTELLANLGLVIAFDGALRRGRMGLAVFLTGAVVSLLSKETGWWLPLVALGIWWRTRSGPWLWTSVAVAALVAATMTWTARGLSHDYTWSLAAVPWTVLRAGSWLLPRPQDLIQVWEASTGTLALGGAAWLAWIGWGIWTWRRGQRWPTAALVAALLCLAPVLGLRDHLVPRYLLSVQACLAVGLSATVAARLPAPRISALVLAALLGLVTHWCVSEILTQRHGRGRPAHRLVAKEMIVRIIWNQLGESGVGPGVDLAFVHRPGDEVKPREYILDVIGRTWGPRLLLGSDSEVVIIDQTADVPIGTVVFGFQGWRMEYLGVRRSAGRQ